MKFVSREKIKVLSEKIISGKLLLQIALYIRFSGRKGCGGKFVENAFEGSVIIIVGIIGIVCSLIIKITVGCK